MPFTGGEDERTLPHSLCENHPADVFSLDCQFNRLAIFRLALAP